MNIYDLKTISIKLFMDVVFENNCENKKKWGLKNHDKQQNHKI